MIRMMGSDLSFRASKFREPHEFTMLEFKKRLIDVTSKSKLVYRPMPQDDPKQRQPIDLAFEKLGRLEAKNRIERSTKTILF
jgi:UDP-glucuronate decarboxylase